MTANEKLDLLNTITAGLTKLANRANIAVCNGRTEFHGIESGCHKDIANIQSIFIGPAHDRTIWIRTEGPKIMRWANEYYKRVNKVI